MKYRTIPGNNEPLSILGFGVMRLPTRAGIIDKRRSTRMLLESIAGGINYFDTAYPYMTGQSEPFLGRFLEEHQLRDEVSIATKLPHWQIRNRQDMINMLVNQLGRLRTDRIDYYLIHSITGGSWSELVRRGVIEFLDVAKREGKILNAGFSWHGLPEDFAGVVDAYNWDFCQIQYNILDERRQAGTAGLEYAASKSLGIVIMEPLRGGNLASRIPGAALSEWRKMPERSPAAWSLAWLWNKPEVSIVLSGFSNVAHIRETMALADEAYPGMLSVNELEGIARVQTAYSEAKIIGCTSCRYCMPCPFGVSIPDVFDWYNEWKTVRPGLAQRVFYLAMVGGIFSKTSGLASRCTACGQCLKKCPQSLPIPELMQKVSKEYEGGLGRFIDRTAAKLWRLFKGKPK